MANNMTWFYDDETGHYVVKGARILFPNFQGAEQDYNPAGKRNFRLQVNSDLAEELRSQGISVREREGRDDTEETQYLVKIGVYPTVDIILRDGNKNNRMVIDNKDHENDDGDLIDGEFSKGHIKNGDISVEFHISRNTRVPNGSLYTRADVVILPVRKSKLLEDIEDDDDDLPM